MRMMAEIKVANIVAVLSNDDEDLLIFDVDLTIIGVDLAYVTG
jgi:hypothetical protein